MSLRSDLLPGLKDKLNQIVRIMHADSIEFAPRGATNELRNGIYFTTAREVGQNIILSIASRAEYSEVQHDKPLAHASSQGGPAYLSFADLGQGTTTIKAYRDGLRRYRSTNNIYPTKFIERAIDENIDLLDNL